MKRALAAGLAAVLLAGARAGEAQPGSVAADSARVPAGLGVPAVATVRVDGDAGEGTVPA